MGNKIIKFILLLLLPSLSLAGQVNYELTSTKDNDNVKLTRSTFSFIPDNIGIGLVDSAYQTPTIEKDSKGILFVSNIKKEKYEIIGNVGLGHSNKKTYLLGDITASYKPSSNSLLNVGLFGDLIDSELSLQNNIDMKGLIIGGDFWIDKFSISIGHKSIWFSDDNYQKGYYLKPSYSIADGINFYITKKYYKNSQPNSFYYFSPETYDRSGGGISFKRKIDSVHISGFIEKTKIKTPFSSDRAILWKITLATPLIDKLQARISLGKDYSNSSQFSYHYINTSIKYEF